MINNHVDCGSFVADRAKRRLSSIEVVNILKLNHKQSKKKVMNENKRKQIEAKLLQLFNQTDNKQNSGTPTQTRPAVVKVIRRRKGKPDLQVA